MIIRYLMVIFLSLAGDALAKRSDIGFLYGAVSRLGWGPTSINAYTTGILRMGGVAVFISTSDHHKVIYNFSLRNLVETTNKRIESVLRETLDGYNSIYHKTTEDSIGYLLVEIGNRVQRYDYLLIDNQLEVIRAASFDRLTYQRSRLLSTLQETLKRPPLKDIEHIFHQELADTTGLRQAIANFKKRLFNPDQHELQVLQTLEGVIDDLTSVVEQQNTILDNSTDYQSSIALITKALRIAGLSLREAIHATEPNKTSAKQLIEIFKAHLEGTIVIGKDNSQQLLSTLKSGISKALLYRIPTSLRLQKEDQVRELLNRAQQIMPTEQIVIRFKNALRNRQHFYGQYHIHDEKIQHTKQQIDDFLLSLTGSQLRNTITDLIGIRELDAKSSRQVLGKKIEYEF